MAASALLLWAFAPGVARAEDDLADFSNNLATDIAPLLVLFGESMTKQYLSESTSPIDYFIFAMGPIGLLTAVVSAIRVCGHSSLRAFVGRSQEGDGAVEAELCTSTSRDVCEMFNRGGITRVLGRPKVLELIHLPGQSLPSGQGHGEDLRTDLLHFGKFLARFGDDTRGWKEARRIGSRRGSTTSGYEGNRLAPKPNLSLNVGIVKRPYWIFVVVAVVGCVLQFGVLALAGVGTWVLNWDVGGEETSASRSYAPIMFIAGTLMMCVGMGTCAALIGQTTHKVTFERTASGPLSRLIWIQPGRQTIGDQTFGPYAYLENTDRRLRTWTSSTRELNEQFEFYTLVAVLLALAGYIMQFIGLRGMKAWVSLSQLGITIIMGILRSALRMQRLGRDDNKLDNISDVVSGHELDWLVFQLVESGPYTGTFWYITGEYDGALAKLSRWYLSEEAYYKNPLFDSPGSKERNEVGRSIPDAHKMFLQRKQLALFTTQKQYGFTDDTDDHFWGDEHVKVRETARRVADAICMAVQSVVSHDRHKHDEIIFGIYARTMKSMVGCPYVPGERHVVSVTVEPPHGLSPGAWTTETEHIESILGLWVWSFFSDYERRTAIQRTSMLVARRCRASKIVSAGPNDKRWNHTMDKDEEMDLWLGPNASRLITKVLYIRPHGGPLDIWENEEHSSAYKSLSPNAVVPNWLRTMRFQGWVPVRQAIQDYFPDCEPGKMCELRVQYATEVQPLLKVCAQELYATLVASLASLLDLSDTVIKEIGDDIRLFSPTVDSLADAFVRNGLGSYTSAVLCIVPALGSRLRIPPVEQRALALLNVIDKRRRVSDWDGAKTIFKRACQQYCEPVIGICSLDHCSVMAKIFRTGGELYRRSLVQNPVNTAFASKGINEMLSEYHKPCHANCEVAEVLNCYKRVIERVITLRKRLSRGSLLSLEKSVVKAIQERNKEDTLYWLTFMPERPWLTTNSEPALPLAVRNDWSEVVAALIEMTARLDGRDQDGRTAISYCAEFGFESYLKELLESGADPDIADKFNRTPLLWAAEKGQVAVTEALLESGRVDPRRADDEGRTPLGLSIVGNFTKIIHLLLTHGVPIDEICTPPWTGLTVAAIHGCVDVLFDLGRKGANVEARDPAGRTPVSWAAGEGHLRAIRWLVASGVDFEALDTRGRTSLFHAARNGHSDVVDTLATLGSNIDGTDDEGSTPLIQSAANGHADVVRLLLEKGANFGQVDSEGRTALWWAESKGHMEIAEILRSYGDDDS